MPIGAFMWILYGLPCELGNAFLLMVAPLWGC